MNTSDLARLNRVLLDAGVPVEGVSFSPGDALPIAVSPPSMQGPAQPVIDAFDWSTEAAATFDNLQQRASAVTLLNNPIEHAKALRAVVSALVKEINAPRQWIMAFKVQVAAATTLADLKTRVAALPNLPDRTLAQAKTVITDEINAGTVDT